MSHSDDPRVKYDVERATIEEDLPDGQASRILEALDAVDPEERSPSLVHDGETIELSTNSLRNYGLRLRMVCREVGGPLTQLDNDDVDDLMDDLLSGDASIGPSDGYATSTAGIFESALKIYFRYHDGHDVDPGEIPVEKQEESSVDERDLWTVEEIERMREVIDSKRDEALFELLAYTGQRIRVIQTLRVKDVDPDKGKTGRYYVNEDVEGRKNRQGHGPLLGAQGAVRRWLNIHPTGDRDDALITRKPGTTGEPGTRVHQTTLRSVLEGIAEDAGVDKDVHPHMFRHYFSTIAKTPKERGGFGMDTDHIKRLRGDAKGSSVFEKTYSHLSDEDSSAHAESQFGDGADEPTVALPAGPCGICGERMQQGDRACSNCGEFRTEDGEDDDTSAEEAMQMMKAMVEQNDGLEMPEI